VNATAYSFNAPSSGSTSTTITGPNITQTRTDSYGPTDIRQRGLVGALGLQAGANYQKDRFVVGLVGDFTWFSRPSNSTYSSSGAFSRTESWTASASSSDIAGVNSTTSSSVTQTNSGQSTYSGSANVAPQWLSTLRLTAGVASDRLLTFVSGGLAFGSVQTRLSSSYGDTLSSSCSGSGNGFANGVQSNAAYVDCGGTANNFTARAEDGQTTNASWNFSSNKMRTGYVVGGGIAYALSDNTILKLESYYYDLGKQTVVVNGTANTTNYAGTTSSTNVASYKVQTSTNGVLGRIGIDFKY
jgi:opacity protein-like surface antigen